MTSCSVVGDPRAVKRQLRELLKATQADEIIATSQIFDHTARLRSFELLAEIFKTFC
jgi:alkanesulfonate monooxygenase SsuD/methylene tetrahydromethanopterin reductase-like flavin-dependent oxidoreductase (luciferase family)